MNGIKHFDKAALKQLGFQGFYTVSELKKCKCNVIPKKQGIYVVYRSSLETPAFIERPLGYRVEDLQDNWIVRAHVLNIGKAGGSAYKTNLLKRIAAYIRFGRSGSSGHRGGRSIWQLNDCNELLIAWKETSDEEPLDAEKTLLKAFIDAYERLPFANRRR